MTKPRPRGCQQRRETAHFYGGRHLPIDRNLTQTMISARDNQRQRTLQSSHTVGQVGCRLKADIRGALSGQMPASGSLQLSCTPVPKCCP